LNTQKQVPYLSEAELSALGVTAAEALAAIEAIIVEREAGRAWMAPKASFTIPDGRFAMSTMAAADNPAYLVVKSLLLNPRNPDNALPLMNSIITLQDSETGLPIAVLDGNWVTDIRTAALSALASRRLAREDASKIAFIGCGAQARSHLELFKQLFPLRAVNAFGRGQPNIDRLRTQADGLGLTTRVAGSAREAVEDADIVVSSVTRTPDMTAFIDADWLKSGAFAALTDLAAPWHRESLTAFDSIVIEDRKQEAAMSQKLAPEELISGDLSELVLGTYAGRSDAKQRTAFLFRGFALGDFALAALAWEKARGQ
jgi:ornithine cyclodeaminase/alanine dehydrogenase